ncbi:UbiA prenyltransferase family protein [Knoellia sinensis]|nr:UbiA prenyltransferase family protein [Knoellia sinensis]
MTTLAPATTLAPSCRPSAAVVAVQVARPWFWPIGIAPAWFGSVVATGSWLPPGVGLWRLAAAALVMGPLVWVSLCTVNDLHDVASDRTNPRKVSSPLVSGAATAAGLARTHLISSGAALGVAALVGPVFALGTALVLALGWAYSAPPLRLKGRPGLDVAANALALGLLAPLAGWSLSRPLVEYPPLLAVLGVTLAAALYAPTTAVDHTSDAAAGDLTLAVRWGPGVVHWLGVGLFAVATGAWMIGLAAGSFGVAVLSPVQWLTAPLPLLTHAVLTRRPSIARLALVCGLFCVPAGEYLTQTLAR